MSEITSRNIETDRITTRVLETGEGEPVVFVHGNLSDAAIWREQLGRLPDGYRGVAVDLRGFGEADVAPIDATRGLRDLSDDVLAVLDAIGLADAHLVGHSTGGGVVMQLAIDAPDRVRSLVLVDTVSPYGYGGTKRDGTPCAPDFAGSGGGAANPELVDRIAAGDRTTESDLSPRNVIRALFFATPGDVRDEDLILDGMLASAVGEENYPGDLTTSEHWPGVAPGEQGILNALSPKYCDLTDIVDAELTVPILWIRGDKDAIVSDTALTDLGHLGAIGAVPGWPGDNEFPAQPMVAQIRDVLEKYRASGGGFREEVLEETGHFAFTQRPDEFAALLHDHLASGKA